MHSVDLKFIAEKLASRLRMSSREFFHEWLVQGTSGACKALIIKLLLIANLSAALFVNLHPSVLKTERVTWKSVGVLLFYGLSCYDMTPVVAAHVQTQKVKGT